MKKIYNFHNFIGNLPAEIQREFIRSTILRTLEDGEFTYRQGDQAKEMYQILKGKIKMCNYSYEGKEIVVTKFQAGDCFGEMSLIDGMPRICHAIAIGHTELRVLGKGGFDKLYSAYPPFSHQLNIMFCQRLRFLISLTEDACILNLNQRLARMILRLAHSQGIQTDNAKAIIIDTSHEELGTILGASRQSISKELKKMQQAGYIDMRYGKIFLKDIDSLNRAYDYLTGLEPITWTYRKE